MRAERLLSILMLLRSKGSVTAAELAAELEVSERTILRDIDSLSLSGVPVYSTRGRNGGFTLMKGYRLELSGLTLGESIALLSGGGRIDSPAAASAKRKLEASLPDMHRGQVAQASQRILVRPEGFVKSGDRLDALPSIQQAVIEGRRVRLVYQARERQPRERVLDPIGLIVAGDTWYLVADSEGSERMYRVSRMSDVEVLDEPARRAVSVDLDEVWERHRDAFRAGFEPVDVVITCAAGDVERFGGPAEVVSVVRDGDGDGSAHVTLRFGDGGRAIRALWMMRFDIEFAIERPISINDALIARARSLVADDETSSTRSVGLPQPRSDKHS